MTRRLLAAIAAAAISWFGLAPLAMAQNYDQIEAPIPSLTNSAVTVKANPGPLLWYSCFNPNSTTAFVQFFDLSTTVTLGVTVPTISWPIPPAAGTGFISPKPSGLTYYAAHAMQVAATTTATGSTGPTTPLNCGFGYR